MVVQAVWKGGRSVVSAKPKSAVGGSHGHLVAIKVTTRSMAENGGRDYESEIAKAKAEVMHYSCDILTCHCLLYL